MLNLLEKLPGFRNLESAIRNLRERTESVSRQLGAWISSLRNSDKKGQRYVTAKVKHAEENKRAREAFLEELSKYRALGASAGTAGSADPQERKHG
jgi:hypothetical protein